MNVQKTEKQNKISIIAFFVMTYAFSWILWIPIALSSQKLLAVQISPFLGIIIGGIGPSLSALILTMAEKGMPGIRSLLGCLFKWRVAIKWYIFILFIPTTIILGSIVLYSLIENLPLNIPNIGDWRIVFLTFILTLLIGGPIGEELGWRGYALPKLLETRNPILTSLIIGMGWGIWHLPLFWIQGSLQAEIPLTWFMISILAEAILYTWVYISTGGSIILMVMLHTSINAWAKLLLLPLIEYSLLPILITFGMEIVIAFMIIIKMRNLHLINIK
jgi:uncharacterized protein